jgi:mRNA-degrading endonuclease RelE of RelBE toxin-antitoxin system
MCNLFFSNHFKKQLKPYLKKYKSLLFDIYNHLHAFDKRLASDLGHCLYKVRIHCKSLPKGKSKSFRLIVYFWKKRHLLIPLTIYFKSKQSNITYKKIKYHWDKVLLEIE